MSIDDLKVGMVLTGTVRNVADFGVFVDLGADELGAVGDDVAQQDAAVLRMARG